MHVFRLFWHQETNIKLCVAPLLIIAEKLETAQMPVRRRMDCRRTIKMNKLELHTQNGDAPHKCNAE